MKKITRLDQLEHVRGELFVKVICPNCENVLISLIPDAEDILISGRCIMCDDCSSQNNFQKDKLSHIALLEEAEVISD